MEIIQLTQTLNINADKDEIYDCLHNLTDKGYNGSEGAEHYVKITNDRGYIQYISKLDRIMRKFQDDMDLKKFIKEVLDDAFVDTGFIAYAPSITEVYDMLVINVAVGFPN